MSVFCSGLWSSDGDEYDECSIPLWVFVCCVEYAKQDLVSPAGKHMIHWVGCAQRQDFPSLAGEQMMHQDVVCFIGLLVVSGSGVCSA